jgi:hypothetical protein
MVTVEIHKNNKVIIVGIYYTIILAFIILVDIY